MASRRRMHVSEIRTIQVHTICVCAAMGETSLTPIVPFLTERRIRIVLLMVEGKFHTSIRSHGMRLLRLFSILGLLTAAAMPAAAQSGDGPWMIRVRGLYLLPADQSDAIPSLNVPADAITVSTKVFPELDIVRFFNANIAAELVLTYPQQHDVELSGTNIGTFKHLPPTLLLQYHLMPDGVVRPYLGAGVNLTLLSSVELNVPGVGALDLEDSSLGWAAQVGADIRIMEGRFLNLDVKKVAIGSDVLAGGDAVSAVGVDPWLFSVGLGVRF